MKLIRCCLVVFSLVWSALAWCTEQAQPLQIVATPNPNVFPLLVALDDNPNLPVRLIPVKDSQGINTALDKGADGVLAMTYTIAQKVVTGTEPDLELQGVYFWRGFFEMTVADVHSFQDLKGKGLIVSGPTSGGNGGGPDIFFQAALLRAGLFPEDFNLCYLPVMQGVALLESGKPMNTEKTCQGGDSAAGILLVEPASSGLKFKSSMSFGTEKTVHRGIDLQTLFSGFSAWKPDELPHGGFAIRREVLVNPVKKSQLAAFVKAYKAAIDKINHADGMFARYRLGRVISRGISQYYGQYKMDLPALVVAKAIKNGEMRFRTDRPLVSIQANLDSFLKEVLNTQMIPPGFYGDFLSH
jgi:hypothetical protein